MFNLRFIFGNGEGDWKFGGKTIQENTVFTHNFREESFPLIALGKTLGKFDQDGVVLQGIVTT